MNQQPAFGRVVRLCVLLLLMPFLSFSQNNIKITGKVLDENGKPVPAVTVQVKGTTNGTATRSDGTFEIMVPSATSVLHISSVGFAEMDFPLENKTTVSISISSMASAMQDVVVVGYGTRKK